MLVIVIKDFLNIKVNFLNLKAKESLGLVFMWITLKLNLQTLMLN